MSDTDTDIESPLEQFVDDSAPDEVEKAKQIGWKAPSDWKGAPPKGKFLKAKEYLERAETVIPIIKSENAKLKAELAEERANLKAFKEETGKTVAKMAQMSKVALDRQRAQLEDKYSDLIDKATEVGDTKAVRELRAAERKDLKEFDEKVEEAAEVKADNTEKAKEKVNAALPKDVQDDIAEWLAENNWYSADEEMQILANFLDGKLTKDKPGLTTKERLAEVRKGVVKRFPEKFGKDEPDDEGDEDKPARGSRVEGGTRSPGGGSGSKFSKLPADAKAQCDKFIKEDGLFLEKGESADKDLAKARERYATQYLES